MFIYHIMGPKITTILCRSQVRHPFGTMHPCCLKVARHNDPENRSLWFIDGATTERSSKEAACCQPQMPLPADWSHRIQALALNDVDSLGLKQFDSLLILFDAENHHRMVT